MCVVGFGLTPAQATDAFYTVTLTTNPSTSVPTAIGTLTPNINLAAVKIKWLEVTLSTAVAQTITIYKNCTSTTTQVEVWSYDCPATAGNYTVIQIRSTIMSNADLINWPYLGVKTSNYSYPAKLKVMYCY